VCQQAYEVYERPGRRRRDREVVGDRGREENKLRVQSYKSAREARGGAPRGETGAAKRVHAGDGERSPQHGAKADEVDGPRDSLKGKPLVRRLVVDHVLVGDRGRARVKKGIERY